MAAFLFSILVFLVPFLSPSPLNADTIQGDKVGVVLMHGKRGDGKHVRSLKSKLKDAGVLVEAPLMPWSKKRIYDKSYEDSMLEIDQIVTRLKKAGAKKIIIAGHSIGANAALGYGARREGLAGIILLAYGHVPGISGYGKRLSKGLGKAKGMINKGKGDIKTKFQDYNEKFFDVGGTPKIILSWFAPDGPATIEGNGSMINQNTPILCVDGSNDKWGRCKSHITRNIPDNSLSKIEIVKASHLTTPSKAGDVVLNWLKKLP